MALDGGSGLTLVGSVKVDGSFPGTGAAFVGKNRQAGDDATVSNWRGYAQDGVTQTSRIAVNGDFYGRQFASLDGSTFLKPTGGIVYIQAAGGIYLTSPGSGITYTSPDGVTAKTVALGDDGTFDVPVGRRHASFTVNSLAFAVKDPSNVVRVKVNGFGDTSIDVKGMSAADAAEWGALVPLTIRHDGDGTLAGDLVAVKLASVTKWAHSKTGVTFMANASTVPAADPTAGGYVYVEGGALKFRGTAGTITTVAAA